MALQNACLNLFARWSRVKAQTEPGPGYAKTSVIVVCEALKIFVAFVLLKFSERLSFSETARKVYRETVGFPMEAAKLLVPSTLYVIQNNLVLVAAENLEGPVLAVFSQAKIFTTAMFSILMLGRVLAPRQWMALLFLASGVASVQISMMESKDGEGDAGEKNVLYGLIASICACCTSGFAGVYFEKATLTLTLSLSLSLTNNPNRNPKPLRCSRAARSPFGCATSTSPSLASSWASSRRSRATASRSPRAASSPATTTSSGRWWWCRPAAACSSPPSSSTRTTSSRPSARPWPSSSRPR
mmetsp:Transcript_15807/g.48205  ORF Transcript_15807/g.48205 Transcript_15807/m.48205 type:complete len:300 (-) Transcript_15807:310-1209(-)